MGTAMNWGPQHPSYPREVPVTETISCPGCGKMAPKQHPVFPHLTLISFLSCGHCKLVKHFVSELWALWWRSRAGTTGEGSGR